VREEVAVRRPVGSSGMPFSLEKQEDDENYQQDVEKG
jgi:hypothetical protein